MTFISKILDFFKIKNKEETKNTADNLEFPQEENPIPTKNEEYYGFWYKGRLCIGVFSILLHFFIVFQSFFAGVLNLFSGNGETSGSSGMILASLFLLAGVFSITLRHTQYLCSAITWIIYWIGWFITPFSSTYKDLSVWTVLSFVFGTIILFSFAMELINEKYEPHSRHFKPIEKKRSKTLIIVINVVISIFCLGTIINFSGMKYSLNTSKNDYKNEFGIGETAELNDIKVTLSDYKESEGSVINKPEDGNVFLLAQLNIENNTENDLAISSVLSFNAYADDYALDFSLSALIEKDGNQLDGTIPAGKKMKGWIGWEVPKDYQKVEIYFSANVWNDEDFVFVIEK